MDNDNSSISIILIIVGILSTAYILLGILSNTENINIPATPEEYNKLANYTIKTTEDEYKLESNIYTNCALFFPEDRNCTKELKIRIFNLSRLP